MPAYTAGYRVLETAYREAYEARGVEGVFQQFGASGLYKLFNEWNTGGYWLSPKSNPNSTFRISAAHWVGDGRRIRDIWVSVSLNNSRGGGGTELRDEEAHRFAGALRSARENPIFDEHVGQVRIMRGVDDYDYLPYRPPIPEGIQILVPWRDVALAVVLDEDEVQEVERALPGAFAEVEFYRTQKKLAESLLDKG